MEQFSDLFQDYVLSSTDYVVTVIRSTTGRLSSSIRKQALHNLSFALTIDAAWPVTRDLLLCLAPKMEQEGYRDNWIPYLEKGIEQSRLLHDLEAEAELCFHFGYLQRLRGRLGQARASLELSLKHFKALKNLHGQAKTLNQCAYIARLAGDYDEAIELLDVALAVLDEHDSERAMSFFVLGTIALDQHSWKAAENYHRHTYQIWVGQQDKRRVAWSLQNLGFALRGQGRYTEAAQYFKHAIEFLEESHDPVNQAIARMNLGIVYSLQGQAHAALRLYGLVEPVFRKARDDLHLAMVHINMAIEYRGLENWDLAKDACLNSMELAGKLGRTKSYLNAMDELGLIYVGQKEYTKAIETFRDALAQLPEIQGVPGHERLFELLTKHLGETIELVWASPHMMKKPMPIS